VCCVQDLSEALGKITAALPKSIQAHSQQYGEVIITALKHETDHPSDDRTVALLGLTAALRARPCESGPLLSRHSYQTRTRGFVRMPKTPSQVAGKGRPPAKLRELLGE